MAEIRHINPVYVDDVNIGELELHTLIAWAPLFCLILAILGVFMFMILWAKRG